MTDWPIAIAGLKATDICEEADEARAVGHDEAERSRPYFEAKWLTN